MADPTIIIVQPDESGIRLDRWITRHYPAANHGFIEKSLRKGLIRLDGKKATSSQRIDEGQSLAIAPFFSEHCQAHSTTPPPKARFHAKDIKALLESILYRDDDIIVINKAPGLAVQGGSKILVSVDAMLDELRFGHSERPKLVHRLDKDTSGLLLIARNARSAATLTAGFRDKTIQKTYLAVVVGTPAKKSGEIRQAISKGKQESGYERVMQDVEGTPAITHYTVKESVPRSVSLLEMMPVTGKTHQLRVHALSLGTPILGDGKYGGKAAFIDGISNKLHLHAHLLTLPTGMAKQQSFIAPLPAHMRESFAFFGWKVN